MLTIGFMISDNISNSITDGSTVYQTTTQVNDNGSFAYAVETNVGNTLAEGNIIAQGTVSFDEVIGEFAYIEKVEEEYRRHTKEVCRSYKGKQICHTETYWTWDEVESQKKECDKFTFYDYELNKAKTLDQLSVNRLKLNEDNVESNMTMQNDYLYENLHKRYYYKVIDKDLTTTLFIHLDETNDWTDFKLFKNKTIEQVIENEKNAIKIDLIFFWIIYIIFIFIVIIGFCYFDNEYLE